MGNYLTRDAILDADDLEQESLEVPEWHGSVMVRALTGTARDAYEASMRQQRGNDFVANFANVRAKLVVRSVIDPETGERVFTDQDANALGKKSAAALDRIFDVAARLSRISDEDVEAMAKNSEDDLPEGSTSG